MILPHLNIDFIGDIVVGVLICESLKYVVVKIATKIDSMIDSPLDVD